MPISVTCPSCEATFRLADEMAGKKVKCQKCQGVIAVSASAKDATPAKKNGNGAPPKKQTGIAAGDKKPKPGKKTEDDEFAIPPEKPTKKTKSGGGGLVLVLLLFLGLGLFGCLGCGAAGFWYF